MDTRLERLGRAPDRTIALPRRPGQAGWYAEGPRPGAAVEVDRADGSTIRFRVTALKQVAKSRFPTDEVYAPDLTPSLRLITCGGSFDRSIRSYRNNVIVFATPA